jgi:hypothetical protein
MQTTGHQYRLILQGGKLNTITIKAFPQAANPATGGSGPGMPV